ncbi:hypothetical protein [Schnuerera sp.]|uniref:hypothetical protein n=1 Tax=Schnuerera sp. TaxID=2794844 RepID=UPI002CE4353C|nr:hypothetical protein [Schnuerera sp.]HSH35265.1 hypothetical protein [Schnuerera sp.]
MSKKEKLDFKNNSHKYKVRYIFREFNFDFKPLSNVSLVKIKINLPKIMVSSHTLGLIMSYYVNYQMSSRQTASIMRDIHGVNISHQTVLNYADKVNGKWQYIFFFFDSVKKIILSYRVNKLSDRHRCPIIPSLSHYYLALT